MEIGECLSDVCGKAVGVESRGGHSIASLPRSPWEGYPPRVCCVRAHRSGLSRPMCVTLRRRDGGGADGRDVNSSQILAVRSPLGVFHGVARVTLCCRYIHPLMMRQPFEMELEAE